MGSSCVNHRDKILQDHLWRVSIDKNLRYYCLKFRLKILVQMVSQIMSQTYQEHVDEKLLVVGSFTGSPLKNN